MHKVRILHNEEEEKKLLEQVKTLTTRIESLQKDQQERAQESCEMTQQLRRVEAELTLKKAAILDIKACCGAARTFD